jgi:3-hydroxyisobutyrate dehydrogenase-like beta-hydroxyacid dehydrogenase
LAQNSSVEANCPTPLGSMAYNFYKQMSNQGFGKKDFAFVYEYLKSKQ